MTKQEVLNYLDNVLHPIVSPDNWNVYSELYDMIEELPSAEPHWILTGDAEPEHCHMVLISVFNAKSDMRFVDTGALYSDGWYGSGLKLPDCCIVTAWQELPKPYEVNHE